MSDDPEPLALELDGIALGDGGAVALAGGAEGGASGRFRAARVSLRGCAVGADGARALARAACLDGALVLRENALGTPARARWRRALASNEPFVFVVADLGRSGVGAAARGGGARGARGVRDLLFGNATMGNEGLMAFAAGDAETSRR